MCIANTHSIALACKQVARVGTHIRSILTKSEEAVLRCRDGYLYLAHHTSLEWVCIKVAYLILSVTVLETLALIVWQVVKTKTMQGVEVLVGCFGVLNILALTIE